MEEIQLKIFIGMNRNINKMNKALNKIHSKYELTSGQFGVLEVLYHKGDLTVGEVQEKILSTSGTIPVIVKNLEKDGLLERGQDALDKRKCILHITKKGKELMDKVYPENKKLIVSMIDVWNEEEQIEILNYMKKFGGIEYEKKNKR